DRARGTRHRALATPVHVPGDRPSRPPAVLVHLAREVLWRDQLLPECEIRRADARLEAGRAREVDQRPGDAGDGDPVDLDGAQRVPRSAVETGVAGGAAAV